MKPFLILLTLYPINVCFINCTIFSTNNSYTIISIIIITTWLDCKDVCIINYYWANVFCSQINIIAYCLNIFVSVNIYVYSYLLNNYWFNFNCWQKSAVITENASNENLLENKYFFNEFVGGETKKYQLFIIVLKICEWYEI